MQNAPNNLADIAETEAKRLETVTNEAIDEIDELLNASIEKAVIPEDVFVEYFLDYFRDPAGQKNTTLPSKWLEISGGPYNEVDVLDNKGNVAYTVPSLFITPTVDARLIARYDFSDIAANYNMQMKITSTSAQNYLSSALSGVPDAVMTDARRHIAKLAAIFARYDTSDSGVTASDNSNKVTTDAKPTASMFDM